MKKLRLLLLAFSMSSVLVQFSGLPANSNDRLETKELFSLARTGTRKQWDQNGVCDPKNINDSFQYSRRQDLAKLIHDCDQMALTSYHKGDVMAASDRLYVCLSCASAFGKGLLAHQNSVVEINDKQAPPLVWLDVFKGLTLSSSKDSPNQCGFPTNSYIPAVNNYAYYLRQEGKYKESIPIFEKIVSIDPGRIVTNLDLADALWQIGEKEKARSFYARYVSAMKKAKLKNVPPRALERSANRN